MPTIEYDQSSTISIDDGVLAWVDNDEKLMWEIKNIDNINMMYVWHTTYLQDTPIIGPDDVPLEYESEVKDATSYVKALNYSNYAGFNNWRLPTIEELKTLIDHEGDNLLIKKPLQKNTSAAYWTDTPNLADNLHIEIVDFSNARMALYKPGNSLWIRCVRSIENGFMNQEEKIGQSFKELQTLLYETEVLDMINNMRATGAVSANQFGLFKQVDALAKKISELSGETPEEIIKIIYSQNG